MGSNQNASNLELSLKLERIHGLLTHCRLDALLLQRFSNFAWATCGAACYINTADSAGNASLLITPAGRFVLTDNIEAGRLIREEGLADQGWEFIISPWYERKDKFHELTRGLKLGADTGFPDAKELTSEIAALRFDLTPEEGERFRALAILCAEGMEKAVEALKPGMTEYEIAGLLSQAVESRGVQAIVNLIATDERIFSYRHPLPTSKKLQRYAMLILCGRKWGLICSLSRFIHFGPLPDDVRYKAEGVAKIDAAMIAATHPGSSLGDVFQHAQSAYASVGYPDEWKLHHQGGLAGYAPREITAIPSSTQPILAGQVYAWNPSIAGAKSEDTILVGEHTNEILTEMKDWPTTEIQIGDQVIKRPAILEKL
jgi:Xaa-Pro aminopeptidase